MRYMMKQKLLCFGDDFSVCDESGREVLYFDGKVMSLRKTIIVNTPDGRELGKIKKRIGTIRPTFVLEQGRDQIAEIYKKALSFRDSFVIDVPGPNDITIVGGVLEHNYSFYRDKLEIAKVSKKWFRNSDTYGIDVYDPKDLFLTLAGAVVVDLLCHPDRDS